VRGGGVRVGAFDIVIAFGVRLLLELLFLPFSARDILDFRGTIIQARREVRSHFIR
jgi:putative oxidoreductase